MRIAPKRRVVGLVLVDEIVFYQHLAAAIGIDRRRHRIEGRVVMYPDILARGINPVALAE